MREVSLKARAKINLGLDVTGRRENGYHDLRMVMQTVGLADVITVTECAEPGPHLVIPNRKAFLPSDDTKNLAWRAANVLLEEFAPNAGVEIRLEKNIPIAAGLAGGSTDAAAVMKGVNEVLGLDLSLQELMDRGVKLGADIPYCLMGGTALAEGIGEILTPLSPAPGGFVLLAKPPVGVSTAWAYGELDAEGVLESIDHPDIDGIVNAIAEGDRDRMCSLMGNVLQEVTIPAHPEIREIRQHMYDLGAVGAMMSGSGPTVFGIFTDEDQAYACSRDLRSGSHCETFVTGFFHERSIK